MNIFNRLLTATGYAFLGALLGLIAGFLAALWTQVGFASIPLFGAGGAALLAVVGLLKTPGTGSGYVSQQGEKDWDRQVFGKGVDDPVDPVDQPIRND